jgi:hypothetical protein
MRRRDFITLVGGTAAWPVTLRAQQSGKLIRLGLLGPTLNNPPAMAQYEAFHTRLEENGFREDRNLTIDYRGLGDPRGPFVVAAELVRSQPDLIVTIGPETSLQAVVGASGFIPVVISPSISIRWHMVISPAWRGRAATSPDWSFSNWSWHGSKSSC